MKKSNMILALFVITLFLPLAVYAHGPHGYHRGGVWIAPVVEPWWWGAYPYYYSIPSVVVERPAEEYYVQPSPPRHEEPAYWYYCRKPEGYYPYIKQCPEGWMKVVPAPPSRNKGE